MVEELDELTGMPRHRPQARPREEGALGPGAEHGDACQPVGIGAIVPRVCACGGIWTVWQDRGRRLLVYRHEPVEGKTYTRAFDEYRHPTARDISGVIEYLTTHEIHPASAPTPGKARRR